MDLVRLDEKSTVIEQHPEKEKLERKLHEVCINHRLAVCLEQVLRCQKIEGYYVDIEYNRYYRNVKNAVIDGIRTVCRPDIIIHKRTKKVKDQHLLIIEAKKDENSDEDRKKIRGFMLDKDYEYKYGARINYKNLSDMEVEFFVLESGKVVSEILPIDD